MLDFHNYQAEFSKGKALCLSLLLGFHSAFSQENIRFERISVNEGLSQSDVKCMIQDKLGFLWVGTRDGLNVYDGYKFQTYTQNKNDSSSLAFNQILDLELDTSGNIWIGSLGGISEYRYKGDYFKNYFLADSGLPEADVNHILLTGSNVVILSTSKGLINFDKEKEIFFIDKALKLFQGQMVYNTYQSTENGFWVGTNNGVYFYSSTHPGWVKLLDGVGVYRIEYSENKMIYLCTTRGLFVYNTQEKKISKIQLPPEFSSIRDIQLLNNGDLWVAGDQIIVLDRDYRVRNILGHDRFNPQSLSEDRARVLYKTDDGAVWVGTFGYGLNKFNPAVASFSYLGDRTTPALSGSYVSSIHTFNDTIIWIGTSRGLDVIDLASKSVKQFTSPEDLFQILKIKSDSKKRIWVTTSKGLMLYSGRDLVLKDPFLKSVYDLEEWDSAQLVLASRVSGIFLYNRNTNKTDTFIPAKELPGEVNCILVDGSYLWVGCSDGLRLFNRKGVLIKLFSARSNLKRSLPSPFIKFIYRDSNKYLWIGTWGGGFSQFNEQDSTFFTYSTDDGLPNNVVYSMLEDDAGILWLSTNNGITAFNRNDTSFRSFTFEDGLQSNEFNTGAYFRSAKNQLYFGGVNGLSYFQPTEILKQSPAPTVLTTAILINNKHLNFETTDSLKNVKMIHHIESGWKANDISLQFSAVDLLSGQRREFQYAITDTSWFDIGSRRSFELLDLPSGKHVVRVRTRVPGYRWSPTVNLLTIDIIPPLWQQAWFQTCIVFAIVVVAFAGYRARIENLREVNLTLNKLVNERTKEIQVINEEIMTQNDQLNILNRELEAFSFSISHDLRAPLRSVIGYSTILEEDYQDKLDDEAKKLLANIRHKARKMDTLVHDLLHFSRTSKQEIKKTEVDMENLVNRILGEMKPSIPSQIKIRLQTLPSVFVDHGLITQVWINLLSNAIKYSSKKPTALIEIGSTVKKDEVIFYVRDNGAGFDMKYADKLFNVFQRLHKTSEFDGVGVGLALVHRIINRHDGRIWAEGKVNEGATFYFTIPKTAETGSTS